MFDCGAGDAGHEADREAAVAAERIPVNQDVRQRAAGIDLVGVDRGSALRADLVVVAEDVLLDDGAVGGAVVGQDQPDDVVLDDVVAELDTGGPAPDAGAGPEGVGAGAVVERKSVERHVTGGDAEGDRLNARGGVRTADDGLGGGRRSAGPRGVAGVEADLVAEEGKGLVDRDELAERPPRDADRVVGRGGVHRALDAVEGVDAERQPGHGGAVPAAGAGIPGDGVAGAQAGGADIGREDEIARVIDEERRRQQPPAFERFGGRTQQPSGGPPAPATGVPRAAVRSIGARCSGPGA